MLLRKSSFIYNKPMIRNFASSQISAPDIPKSEAHWLSIVDPWPAKYYTLFKVSLEKTGLQVLVSILRYVCLGQGDW